MPVTHAGVAVQAADTGRILMIQRTLDPADPAEVQGTWEFPGGGMEDGETPEAAAWREFSEETGLAQPAGEMTGGWTSADGVYQAFVFTTPTEADAFGEMNPDHQAAVAENPDDPGRRAPDVQAWFTREQIQGLGPALRPEVGEQTDWSQFAAGQPVQVTVAAARVTVDRGRRVIRGTLVRYGETGQTTAGPLRVRPGAIRVPSVAASVTLTPEHENDKRRGQLALVDDTDERMHVAIQADAGQDGDAALAEADSRDRGGLSFWVVNPVIEPATDGGAPWLTSADLDRIGQVADPAFNSSRIDHVAATKTPGASRTNTGGNSMTKEQRLRLAELRAIEARTEDQETELAALVALAVDEATAEPTEGEPVEGEPTEGEPAEGEPAPQAVAAGRPIPAVPGGLPMPRARTKSRGKSYNDVVKEVTKALQSQALNGTSAVAAIGAAFTDVISTDHTGNVEPLAWSGELWSGLEYQPVFLDLLQGDTLQWFEGKGWRFTVTPDMQDYTGDKAAVPSGTVVTEPSSYEAARMAVGVDIDRKFYDFPNEDFVNGLFERIRESWTIQQDAKVRAYIQANSPKLTRAASASRTAADATLTAAAPGTFKPAMIGSTVTGTGIPAATTIISVNAAGTEAEMSANATTGAPTVTALTIDTAEASILKATGRLVQGLKNTRVGAPSFIVMNDDDYFSLMDINEQTLPVYLDLWGIDPKNFRSSPDVTAGTVIGGAKQAAKYRTLPGSPIRVSAQHLANGGVDEAFFGYWAVEKHHPQGIRSVRFNSTSVAS